MIDSLELYKEILTANTGHGYRLPTENDLKNYYLQLLTTTFYELTAKKTSPLISLFCQMNLKNFAPKNFKTVPQQSFNLPTTFDMYMVVDGLNYALAESLDSSWKICETYKKNIFRGASLQENYLPELLKILMKLDEALGKFCSAERVVEKVVERRVEVPVEKIVERRVEVPVEKIISAQVEDDKDFLQNLNELCKTRRADDEKIIDEIKKVQLALQDELPRLQGTLKTISAIRDELEFQSAEEPINQLIQLYDKLSETLQSHPQTNLQKGYATLIKRCRNFSRYLEQSLAMLGAELINETNIPLDFGKHEVTNAERATEAAIVSKILRVGLIYKGQILRKAEVEIVGR